MTNAASLYGKSLYDLAKSEGLADQIMEAAEAVGQLFAQNPDYLKLLSEPSIPKKERLGLLSEAFGDSIPEYLLSFLMILTEKGLLLRYKECFKTYRTLYHADQGICDATVYSAVALTDAQKEGLKQILQKKTGKTIYLTERIDESVLGGLKVEVDGKTLDGTVASRLAALRGQLRDINL